jgi:phenylacetate-CoA ligase
MTSIAKSLDYVASDEKRAFQLHQMQCLWQAAIEHTEHYGGMVARREAPRTLGSLADVEQIPLLHKRDVRQLRWSLYPQTSRRSDYRLATTGGTTGEPLELRVSHAASAAEWALMLDSWARVGFGPRSRRAVLRGLPVDDREKGRRSVVDGVNRALVLSGFDLTPKDMDQYVGLMKRHRVEFLHAYPSTAYYLARHILRTGVEPPRLRCVLLGSETIYPWQTRTISAGFRCPTYSWYGHTEKCVFASECEVGDGYHPSAPYGLVELVDASGHTINEPGVRGVIVGTGFTNRATALIRYVTDDEAEWLDEPCNCGRSGWRLMNVVGHRGQETLVGKLGEPVSITTLHGIHDAAFAHVLKYQIRQQELGRADFLFVKSATFTDAHEQALHDVLTSRLAGTIELRLLSVADIPPTSSGKHRFVDQRIPGVGDLSELRVGDEGSIVPPSDSGTVD